MAYSAILGQTPEIPDPAPPTAAQVSYNRSASSAVISSTNVQGAIDDLAEYAQDLFTSVSNGKNQIASAITDKGVSASGSESFASLAGKIGQIPTPQTPGNILIINSDVKGDYNLPPLGRLPKYLSFIQLRAMIDGPSGPYPSGQCVYYGMFYDYPNNRRIKKGDSGTVYWDTIPTNQTQQIAATSGFVGPKLGSYYYEYAPILITAVWQ